MDPDRKQLLLDASTAWANPDVERQEELTCFSCCRVFRDHEEKRRHRVLVRGIVQCPAKARFRSFRRGPDFVLALSHSMRKVTG